MEIFMAAREIKKFDLHFAIQVALLYDVLEDTDTPFDEIKEKFGEDIATAVQALSKDKKVPKEQ